MLVARSADPARTLLRLRCNLSLFRQLSIESGFIIWPTGVNFTLSLRAMPVSLLGSSLSFHVRPAHGDLRAQKKKRKKRKEKKRKNRWHCICFRKRPAFLALPSLKESENLSEEALTASNGAQLSLARESMLLLRLDEGQLTSAS